MRFFRFLCGWWGAPPVGATPAARVFHVAAELRAWAIAHERRSFIVPAETRIFYV